jgi:hypothetical protein
MIDDRFSPGEFERAGYGTMGARKLSRELEEEIQEELDTVLRPAFLKIIEELNSMGHKLQLRGEARVGEISFVEPRRDASNRYKFLVALDVIIPTGYPDLADEPFVFEEPEE